MKDEFDFDHPNAEEKYDTAYKMVQMILDHDPLAIKKIRQEESAFTKMKPSLLQKHIPHLSDEQARQLSKRFLE